ncbi:hypothetical protein OKA05_10570 [Luteolibacter arcticus]|uniref:Uncharacterized protein n=1 Tax=Luteolibacter arcticus TaxID=1581411 RepID=A0ABT3GHA5_9BACT|nr:hypothetical protein [Luteolibacter arcticus]MCW1922996.1 hypothetical protein [Luteolibacter arcticus]
MSDNTSDNTPVPQVLSPIMETQKNSPLWPSTWLQFTSFLIMLAVCLGGLVYYLRFANDHDRRAISMLIATPDGKEPGYTENSYNLGFWTPDELTDEDMANSTDSNYDWQKGSSEDKNLKFEEVLLKRCGDHMLGWRRHPIVGLGGSRTRKHGQWWTVTLHDSITPQDFAEKYKEFWKPRSKVYFEVVGRPHRMEPFSTSSEGVTKAKDGDAEKK